MDLQKKKVVKKKVVKKTAKSKSLTAEDVKNKIITTAGNAYGEENVECKIIGGLIQTIIRFPKVDIHNGTGESDSKTTIYDLFVSFNISCTTFRLLSGVKGRVMKASWYNLLSGYKHSHLHRASNCSRDGWDWDTFCTGSGPINDIVNRSCVEQNKDKLINHIIAYIFHLREFVSWQSDSGVPYYYLNKRNEYLYSSNASTQVNSDRYLDRPCHEAVLYEIIDILKDNLKLNIAYNEYNTPRISLNYPSLSHELRMFVAAELKKRINNSSYFWGVICYETKNSFEQYTEIPESNISSLKTVIEQMCNRISKYEFKGKEICFECVDLEDLEKINDSSQVEVYQEVVNTYLLNEALDRAHTISNFYKNNSLKLTE